MVKSLKLKPCPICGKIPKIKRNYSSEYNMFGAWCTIQCKPLFRKPHLRIVEGKASWDRALLYGMEHWNEEVKKINNEK